MLVIDQFEELFTLVEDETERRRFLANLVAALDDPHGRVVVIVTLRADSYHRPLGYAESRGTAGIKRRQRAAADIGRTGVRRTGARGTRVACLLNRHCSPSCLPT